MPRCDPPSTCSSRSRRSKDCIAARILAAHGVTPAALPKLAGLARRELERLLQARGDAPARGHSAVERAESCALERAGSERLLHTTADLVEIDADRGERIGVDRAASRIDASPDDALDVAPDDVAGESEPPEHLRCG